MQKINILSSRVECNLLVPEARVVLQMIGRWLQDKWLPRQEAIGVHVFQCSRHLHQVHEHQLVYQPKRPIYTRVKFIYNTFGCKA